MRGELTADKETQVIQSLIGKGLEREELRDEILVQCVRQVRYFESLGTTLHYYIEYYREERFSYLFVFNTLRNYGTDLN